MAEAVSSSHNWFSHFGAQQTVMKKTAVSG